MLWRLRLQQQTLPAASTRLLRFNSTHVPAAASSSNYYRGKDIQAKDHPYGVPTCTLVWTFEHGFWGAKTHDAMGKMGTVYIPTDRALTDADADADAERVLNLPVQSSCPLTGSKILKAGRIIVEMRTPPGLASN